MNKEPSLSRPSSRRYRSFERKVVLVTGAASGIGRALVTELESAGAIVEASDVDPAIATMRGVRRGTVVDVTDTVAVRAWIEGAAQRHGSLDIVINNAGAAIGGEAQNLSADDWSRQIDVNLNGVVYGVQAAYPIMVRQRSGHIVNVASIAGLVPCPLAIPYTTAKHAVVGLSTALRVEGAAHGVRVTVVCPGAIRTDIWNRSVLRGVDRALALSRVPRYESAESCARQILDGILRNREHVVVTAEAKLLWAIKRISPSLASHVARYTLANLKKTHVVTQSRDVVLS